LSFSAGDPNTLDVGGKSKTVPLPSRYEVASLPRAAPRSRSNRTAFAVCLTVSLYYKYRQFQANPLEFFKVFHICRKSLWRKDLGRRRPRRRVVTPYHQRSYVDL